MEINLHKSCLLVNGLGDSLQRRLTHLFPMILESLAKGVKYLGFHLQPNDYKYVDWLWLVKKIEDRISCWCHRWLSREGRLVLVKSILESIHVYWLSIAHIPKGILDKIRRKCFNFLWSGRRLEEGIPLVKWTRIASPRSSEDGI
jgi:hypothetical protein